MNLGGGYTSQSIVVENTVKVSGQLPTSKQYLTLSYLID